MCPKTKFSNGPPLCTSLNFVYKNQNYKIQNTPFVFKIFDLKAYVNMTCINIWLIHLYKHDL